MRDSKRDDGARARVRDHLAKTGVLDRCILAPSGRLRVLGRSVPLTVPNDESIRSFLISGSGRSGTTLLRRLLMTSPEVHIPPETYVLGRVLTVFHTYRYLPWQQLCELMLAQFTSHPESGTLNLPTPGIIKAVSTLPRHQRSLARFLDTVYRAHASAVGRESPVVWGDKSPIHTLELFRLHRALPNMKTIHMVRHPFDVIASFNESGLLSANEALSTWKRRTAVALEYEDRHPDSVLTVRYEDLVRDSNLVVARVSDMLGVSRDSVSVEQEVPIDQLGDVPAHPHHARVNSPVTSTRIGRGGERLSTLERRRIVSVIGDMMERLGYAS